MNQLTKILLSVLCFGLFSQSVMAQAKVDPKTGKLVKNFIGTVTKSAGKVEVTRKSENEKTMVTRGIKIKKSDIIRTKKSSFVRIVMIDKTVINLGPNSIFKFEEFKLKGEGNRKSVYNFIQGKLRTAIKKKAKPGELMIKAGSVSMGIRGTEIITEITKEGGKSRTKIALVEGKVQVDARKAGVSHTKFFDLGKGVLFDSALLREEGKLQDALKHLPSESMRKLESVEVDNASAFAPFLDEIPTDIFGKDPKAGDVEKKRKKSDKKTSWRDELNRLRKRQNIVAEGYRRKTKIDKQFEVKKRAPASATTGPKECKVIEECLEFQYHEIRGKMIPFCKRKSKSYSPAGCNP